MSFCRVLTHYGVYNTNITPQLIQDILLSIDNTIDASELNISEITIDFSIESPPPDVPCFINKNELHKLEKLYKKSSFEYVNTILWEFLSIHPKTKIKLEFVDKIIELSTTKSLSERDLDNLVQENDNFKFQSFESFKNHLIKLHGIDYEEYKAYKIGKLQSFKKHLYSNCKYPHIVQLYTKPVIQKLSKPFYIEVYPGMNNDDLFRQIINIRQNMSSSFIQDLPQKHTFQILYDALLLYKYMQYTNFEYEKATRFYNFHLLKVYGIKKFIHNFKSQKPIKREKNDFSPPMYHIETYTKLELKKNKINERKKIIPQIMTLLNLV